MTAGSQAFADAFLADRGANTACSDISQGTLVRDGDGFRFSGRWGFLAAARARPGWAARERSPDRSTASAGAVGAGRRARIEDTWRVVGMIATGSHT